MEKFRVRVAKGNENYDLLITREQVELLDWLCGTTLCDFDYYFLGKDETIDLTKNF